MQRRCLLIDIIHAFSFQLLHCVLEKHLAPVEWKQSVCENAELHALCSVLPKFQFLDNVYPLVRNIHLLVKMRSRTIEEINFLRLSGAVPRGIIIFTYDRNSPSALQTLRLWEDRCAYR